ncbi:hypothetical protein [Mycetocola sp. JXN-3]|uniref:hypothetical protein n=1 Tax=Mycetocola sp. JXN-3 TaxID=2116510 RepID=UPI00165D2862|nr:hypothetical protein [Mycetocola sp. JXN-3]
MNLFMPILGAVLLVPFLIAGIPGRRPSKRRATKPPRSRDRLSLISGAVGILVILVLVRQMGTWTPETLWSWFALVALAALALAGMAFRGYSRPWIRPDRPAPVRIGVTGVIALIGAVVVGTLTL